MLSDLLAGILRGHEAARMHPLAGHPLARIIRSDLPAAVRTRIRGTYPDLILRASPGWRGWAAIPWLGIFDPTITRRATTGVYVAILIDPEGGQVFLSLVHGTNAVIHSHGTEAGRAILNARTAELARRAGDLPPPFSAGPIAIAARTPLARDYECGHAFGTRYTLTDLPHRDVGAEVEALLHIHRRMVLRGDITPPFRPRVSGPR